MKHLLILGLLLSSFIANACIKNNQKTKCCLARARHCFDEIQSGELKPSRTKSVCKEVYDKCVKNKECK